MPDETTIVDFALITALEEERDRVLAHLPDARILPKDDSDSHTFYVAEVGSSSPHFVATRVIVTCMASMGPVQSAVRAASLLRKFQPRNVLMVGIAGGVEGEVALGDVIIANQVVDYSAAKITPDGRSIRWQVYPADAKLLDSSVALEGGWEDAVQAERPAQGVPRRYIGVIASGGHVIASTQAIHELKATWPKLIGVEMEGAGVAVVVHDDPARPRFLMVRGVSDLANEDKHRAHVKLWRQYACDTAAAYAMALIRATKSRSSESGTAKESPGRIDGKALRERIESVFSVQELDIFISDAFPDITRGIETIVSPVHELPYKAFKVVQYFKARDRLAELSMKVDQYLSER